MATNNKKSLSKRTREYETGGGIGARMLRAAEKPRDAKATLKRIAGLLKQQWSSVILVAVLISLYAISSIGAVKAISNTIRAIQYNQSIYKPLITAAAFFIVSAVSNWLQTRINAGISSRVIKKLRGDAFTHMQRLPIYFFDAKQHGELISRLTNDIDKVADTLSTSLPAFLSGIMMAITALVGMLTESVEYTMYTFITLPIGFILTIFIAKTSGKQFKLHQKLLGNITARVEETVSAQKTITAYSNQDIYCERFNQDSDQLARVSAKAQFISGIMMPLMNFTGNISYVAVVAIGSIMAARGRSDVAMISAFLTLSRQFSRPLNELSGQANTILAAIAGAERVFELLDMDPEPADVDNSADVSRFHGDVRFINANFGYVDDNLVLEGFNLEVHSGQMIALVGPTGAGKTTVVNLLSRFYELDSGQILIDNIDITDISMESLRRNMGIVLQDSVLFNMSIRDNISYGKPDASMEEIRHVASLARCAGWIERLPDGYNTMVAVDGENLSQGQRQMLTIARALLVDPSILILDEATSSVDTRTEVLLQEAMKVLMKGRTSFVIAHRLSTIKNADIIVIIDKGKIIEQGSHKQLMQLNGLYASLYKGQFTN